jgi:predicted ATP-grasp superfamily ATP-dependent carboligase
MYGDPMEPLRWESRPDGLRAPAFICAFRGWNDAADAASSALTYVIRALGAQRFATIEPEEFYDFQTARPRIKLSDGRAHPVTWPQVELFEARAPRAHRDLVLLLGTEPSLRWRAFSTMILELVQTLGTTLFVTVGALLDDIPHTRPVAVTGTATDPELVARLGLGPPSYEGPTGITGVLQAACQDRGLASASLWAAVPHYVATTPNPKAALALIRKLEGLVGVAIPAPGLESAAADYERQVDLAVQSDPDVQAFVERLEQAADSAPAKDEGPLPSGEAIALDLQRFLRQHGGEDPPAPDA